MKPPFLESKASIPPQEMPGHRMTSQGAVVSWLQSVLDTEPSRILMETGCGRLISYREFHEQSGKIAKALIARGVSSGDRVVVQVEKSPEAVMLYWACLRIGAIFVPLNTAYTHPEVQYFVEDAEPKVFITRPESSTALYELARKSGVVSVETLGSDGRGSLIDLAHADSGPEVTEFVSTPDDLAVILYTSGTTGRSKGAMLTHGNLASNARTLAHVWEFSEADVLLHALPIFHAHGLFVGINTTLVTGSRMLFLARFDAQEVMSLLPRVTALMGVPTFYSRLLQLPGLNRAALAHIRLLISGSAPLLAETHREFERRTGHAILERYGMTETLMNTSNPYRGRRVPGSVGPALPGVEIRVTDPLSGEVLDEGVGMLEVRGPNVCQGYWRNPEKTDAEFRKDGFFITGDLGCIDAEGYVSIVGRGKDLIITGGYNVYPKEVEDEINALPEVIESAVIGLPHADLGEGVTAIVVKAPVSELNEVQVIRALESRLARFKLPKRVLFVAELPRNTMGKVQKTVLRTLHAALYQD